MDILTSVKDLTDARGKGTKEENKKVDNKPNPYSQQSMHENQKKTIYNRKTQT